MWEFAGGGDPVPWTAAASPVGVTLHDATVTVKGPCAVGNTGKVVARAPDGTWGVVVPDGPSANGESLYAVDVTDDGERIWFAGANGALGCYEVGPGRRLDRSEPDGVTAAFGALTVAGERGSEKLLVADGSGNVYAAELAGRTLDWGPVSRPSGDTAVTGLAASPDGVGYAVDSNANVVRTTADDGWRRLGVDDAQNSFYAVAAAEGTLLAGGGNGRVYLSADDGRTWTPYSLGSFTVRTLAVAGGQAVAAGTGGTVLVRTDGGWRRDGWTGSKTVRGLALADPPVAVGNGGLILERTGP